MLHGIPLYEHHNLTSDEHGVISSFHWETVNIVLESSDSGSRLHVLISPVPPLTNLFKLLNFLGLSYFICKMGRN